MGKSNAFTERADVEKLSFDSQLCGEEENG